MKGSDEMIIRNCTLFDGDEFHRGKRDICIKDGKVTDIMPAGEVECKGREIDASDMTAAPGFVDIHTHGAGGYDNSDITEAELDDMISVYNFNGTTTFIPTFPTISTEQARKSLEIYSKRADIPGVYLEGPFINVKKRGAQNPMHIKPPTVKAFENIAEGYHDNILMVMLAPELDEGFKLTEHLVSKGIKISFGHTMCDSDTASSFFDKTDAVATHMFNAMPSIHHRDPTITTVALNRDNVMCEVIPDLIHVHPEIIKLIYKIKGGGGTILVSDSMLAAGLPDGEYDFSGLKVTVKGKKAELETGNLAGSLVKPSEGVVNLTGVGIEPADVLMSATSTPARAMGIQNVAGYVKKGGAADIVLLDRKYNVVHVIKGGNLIR